MGIMLSGSQRRTRLEAVRINPRGGRAASQDVELFTRATELGPLPKPFEVTKVLANAALKGSIKTEVSTMPEQYPESFQELVEDAEAEAAQQAPVGYTFAPLPPELIERPEE